MRFLKREEAGVTLVESLVALSILAILSSFILPFMAQQRMIVAEFSSQSSCSIEVSQIDSKIKSMDGGRTGYWTPEYSATNRIGQSTSDQTSASLKYFPEKIGLKYPLSSSIAPHNLKTRFEKFLPAGMPGERSLAFPRELRSRSLTNAPFKGIRLPTQSSSSSPSSDYLLLESDGYTLYTPLLLKGPVAYVGDLYNGVTGIDYCTKPQPVPKALLSNEPAPGEKYFMQVEALDLSTNPPTPLKGCERRWPRAAHSESEISAPYINDPFNFSNNESGRFTFYLGGDSTDANQGNLWQFPKSIQRNIGYRIKYTVEKIDAGKPIRCEQQSIYQLARDYHNVINAAVDFDFQAQQVSSGTTDKNLAYTLGIKTSKLSDKKQQGIKDLSQAVFANSATEKERNLFTSFTNLGAPPEVYGRNRRLCTQDQKDTFEFKIRIAVKNFDKESGAVLMCLDDSLQLFMNSEVRGTQWCGVNKSNATQENNASLFLSFDKYDRPGHMYHNKKIMQGWVPCDQMKLCGQPPVRAEIIKNSDDPASFSTMEQKRDVRGRLDYVMTYRLNNGRNKNEQNKLWGCDIGYRVVLVDPNGNLSYPQDKKATDELIAKKQSDSSPTLASWKSRCSQGFECEKPIPKLVEPKIYFKPPPCYTCQCNQCVSSGGFWGFLFSILKILVIIFFVLVVVGMGAGILGAAALFKVIWLAAAVTLAAIAYCTFRNCDIGAGGYSFFNATLSSDVVTCADVNNANSGKSGVNNLGQSLPNTCGSCGMTCNRVNPPSPEWTDTVDPLNEDSDGNRYRCGPTVESQVIKEPFGNLSTLYPVLKGNKTLLSTPLSTSHGVFKYSYPGIDISSLTVRPDADKFRVDLYESVKFSTLELKKGMMCIQEFECAPTKTSPLTTFPILPGFPTTPAKTPLAKFQVTKEDLQYNEVDVWGNMKPVTKAGANKNACVSIDVEIVPSYKLAPKIYSLSELLTVDSKPSESTDQCLSMGASNEPNFLYPVKFSDPTQFEAKPTVGTPFPYGKKFEPNVECGDLIGAGSTQTLRITEGNRRFGIYDPSFCAEDFASSAGATAAAKTLEFTLKTGGVRRCFARCIQSIAGGKSVPSDPTKPSQFLLYAPYNPVTHSKLKFCDALKSVSFDRVVNP